MHTYETVLRLGQTDSAGIAYYVSVFEIIHECYESFLDIAEVLREGEYLLPIVHAEADYRAMMELSDRITVEMRLAETGRSSYTLSYRLVNQRGQITAEAVTVHSVVDRKSGKSVEIPGEIRQRLEEIRGNYE